MKSDKSRETFVPAKHYSSVRLQQGRVLADADWNEQSDIIEHRDETTSLDVIGQSGAPVDNAGFTITSGPFEDGVADLNISAGRMYVDGILCELEAPLMYSTQPDPVYDPNLNTPPTIPTGLVLAYLDVWERHIGVIEDPQIREVALGGPDTATRAKTVWQVKTVAIENNATVADTLAGLQPANPGALAARAQPTDTPTDPCIIPQAAGFRSLENQLYRVEVHTPGTLVDDASDNGASPPAGEAAPTFKWSRDNGSVVAAWIDDSHPLPNTLKVQLLTNDPTRGFSVGDWVELTDDRLDLSGFGGTFLQLTQVDGDVLTYSTDPSTIIRFPGLPAPTPITRPDDSFHPKVRRWDMPANSGGPQPVILNASDPMTDPDGSFIDLENGVQIQFEAGDYRTGDYWIIPARTATNDVEWPPMTNDPDSPPAQLTAFGIQHHLACLATFNLSSTGFAAAPDTSCRKLFSPLTDLNPVTPNNLPQPGEWRYYLVDGTRTAGDDNSGKVGISNQSAPAAYTAAVPFATLSAALATFSRDGNDSTAVIMLTPLQLPNRYDDLILQGVHGYRKVLVRCSAFVDPDTLQKIDPLDDSDWTVLGATSTGPFSPSDQVGSVLGGNVINVSKSTIIGAADDALVGQRLRFLPVSNSQIAGFVTMVLGNRTVNGAETLTIGDGLSNLPGGPDQFVLENPSAPFANVVISAAGGDFFLVGGSEPFSFFSLSVVGLQVQNMALSGPIVAEVAFCQITDAIGVNRGSGVSLTHFGHAALSPNYSDEVGTERSAGVGVNVDNFIGAVDGDQLEIRNCAGFSSEFDDVDGLEIGQGFFIQTAQVIDCKRFSIGAELTAVGQPRFIRIGSNLTGGPALQITNSDGEVLGTTFDISNIHNDSGIPFDFNPDDSVDLSAIQFIGTGKALRIRDVDLTLASTQNSQNSASGILLDATGAVSSVFDYEQRVGTTVSGLIALPGRSIFRPIELAFTDVRDPANNHLLSPGVSSVSVAAGASTLVSGQGRSFIERGIAVQGTTVVHQQNGGAATTGIARYRVVQYVGDGTSRVRLARIDLTDVVTGASVSPQQIAASFAGVMQHEVQFAEDSKAFGTLISSGYTLVALDSPPAASVQLPVPVYLSSLWGVATLVPTTNQFLAVVRIGWLVRIVVSGGFGNNLGGGDGVYGLVKIQVDIDGAAPGTPQAG